MQPLMKGLAESPTVMQVDNESQHWQLAIGQEATIAHLRLAISMHPSCLLALPAVRPGMHLKWLNSSPREGKSQQALVLEQPRIYGQQ